MLIDIIDERLDNRGPTLTLQQSTDLLNFCFACGVRLFYVNFIYTDEGEAACREFYRRLDPFLNGKHMVERIEGQGFELQECWNFNRASIDFILDAVNGDLFAYDYYDAPEDWVFYRGDSIFFQIVTHEKEAALRLTEAEYDLFKKLRIPHGQGRLQWTRLPESPDRRSLGSNAASTGHRS